MAKMTVWVWDGKGIIPRVYYTSICNNPPTVFRISPRGLIVLASQARARSKRMPVSCLLSRTQPRYIAKHDFAAIELEVTPYMFPTTFPTKVTKDESLLPIVSKLLNSISVILFHPLSPALSSSFIQTFRNLELRIPEAVSTSHV